MSVTLPTDGQEDWDVPLNAALTDLDTRITAQSDHGNLTGLTDDDHPQYVQHSDQPPTAIMYPGQADPWRQVFYQKGATVYAQSQRAAENTVYKSTDTGSTWTALASTGLANKLVNLIRVEGTGTLIGVTDVLNVVRSTDDGANWSTITALNYLPLGPQGLTATPSGYILIGEYGNVGAATYRIMRSTNDGASFSQVLISTSDGNSSDPGHIHSIVYDAFASKFVAFMDSTLPKIYASSDEGATWTLIGTGASQSAPVNFVAPMFFTDYVAWGVDNELNGAIYRLPRADFYAGTWSAPELVAQVSANVFYHTLPIRADQWLVCAASENVGSATDRGSWASDHYIVYDNGSKVVGAFRHQSPGSVMATQGGHKSRPVQTVPNDYTNLNGNLWLNLPNGGAPANYAAMPVSVGYSTPMPSTFGGLTGQLVLSNNTAIRGRLKDTTTASDMILLDDNNRVIVRNSAASPTPEMRLYEGSTDLAAILVGGTIILGVKSTAVIVNATLYLGPNTSSQSIRTGSGTPEGAVTAPVGSIYMRTNGGAATSFYVKESGTGNTGWVAK